MGSNLKKAISGMNEIELRLVIAATEAICSGINPDKFSKSAKDVYGRIEPCISDLSATKQRQLAQRVLQAVQDQMKRKR